jgi:hypothetical protein
MLKLKIVTSDFYDNERKVFISETFDIELEHSLASLSKWEEIWEIPLLTVEDKTDEQAISYIKCMCLTPDVPPEIFDKLDRAHMQAVEDYMDKKHTATWFSKQPEASSGEAITAELIYFWMSSFNIDWQAQYWNLNRLLTLIKVFSVKQDNKPIRQSTVERRKEIAQINAQRLKEMNSKG